MIPLRDVAQGSGRTDAKTRRVRAAFAGTRSRPAAEERRRLPKNAAARLQGWLGGTSLGQIVLAAPQQRGAAVVRGHLRGGTQP